MGSDHVETAAHPPVGHRDTCQGGNGDGGGNTRHHLEGDACCLESQRLLTAPAKDKGVASLEPGHPQALFGQFHQSLRNLLLGSGMTAQPLAHVDAPGLGRSSLKQLVSNEIIVDHCIALAQQFQSTQSDQVGLAAACADEIDAAGRLAHGSSSVSKLSKDCVSSRVSGPPAWRAAAKSRERQAER